MRILIIDDSKLKTVWMENILKERDISFDKVQNFNEALLESINKSYDGIILDMQFPIFEDSQIQLRTGESFLNSINHKGWHIPVLGNSSIEFKNICEYPYFKGQVYDLGVMEKETVLKFLESIEKEQS